MTTIEKIKAEIERQRKFIEGMFIEGDNNFYDGQDDAYNNILTFLSTLEEEKPTTNDLEEAAEKSSTQYYQDAGYSPFPNVETAAHKSGFIAGAKWQKEQDDKELSDLLTIAHLQGAEQMKEQMMKEAREADVNTYRDLAAGKSWAEFVVEKPPKNLGDKVRIIILKKEVEE